MMKERVGWRRNHRESGLNDLTRFRRRERWENREGSSELLRGYHPAVSVLVGFPGPSRKLRNLPPMAMKVATTTRSVSVSTPVS